MNEAGEGRWEDARRQMVGRWRAILERIQAHDEGGVLEMCNVMDEFCDEAIALRSRAAPGTEAAPDPAFKAETAGGLAGTRCLFCRGFLEMGGCLGLVGEVNRAVLSGRWEEAGRLAEAYLVRLETMDFAGSS